MDELILVHESLKGVDVKITQVSPTSLTVSYDDYVHKLDNVTDPTIYTNLLKKRAPLLFIDKDLNYTLYGWSSMLRSLKKRGVSFIVEEGIIYASANGEDIGYYNVLTGHMKIKSKEQGGFFVEWLLLMKVKL